LSWRILAYGRSHVGRVRDRNEDSLFVKASSGLVVVADGMGGAPAGDVASLLAVQEVVEGLQAGVGMEDAILAANGKIREMAEAKPAFSGMGTTLTALKIFLGESKYILGHIGDSRAYLLSGQEFRQLSADHTMIREMVDSGKLPASAEVGHPLGHILSRVLGTDPSPNVDIDEGELREGDCFLLCSDGLGRVVDSEEIEEWIRRTEAEPMENLVDWLIDEANRRGAPDNVTVALLKVCSEPPSDQSAR
jgi:serine/threonine protein phosphatase PrpC